jgi:hypothetical protein
LNNKNEIDVTDLIPQKKLWDIFICTAIKLGKGKLMSNNEYEMKIVYKKIK